MKVYRGQVRKWAMKEVNIKRGPTPANKTLLLLINEKFSASYKNLNIAYKDFLRRTQKGQVKEKTDVVSDEFLRTFEWRQLRYKALKLHGRRCQCCGASPETGAVLNVDHIKPRRKFPELALELKNLQVLCADCNHGKGSWDQTDFRPTPVILRKQAKEVENV